MTIKDYRTQNVKAQMSSNEGKIGNSNNSVFRIPNNIAGNAFSKKLKALMWFASRISIITSLFIYQLSPLVAQNSAPDCEVIFDKMFNAMKQLKTLKYNLYAEERIENRIVRSTSLIKINVSPFKAYYKDLQKGLEALYVDGEEDNEAIINPNGFPYVNLHLDPNGKLMHKDAHQTIQRLGYGYMGSIIYHSLSRIPDAYQKYVHYSKDTLCDSNWCYKIVINFPEFHYYTVLVKDKGESVNTLADKFYLNNYIVLTTNHLSSYEDEFKVGQILTIPNAYAKTILLLVRKDINLPVYAEVYDDKGLFELYKFINVCVNPVFTDDEFTESHSGYKF
jgi:hypothetical protein